MAVKEVEAYITKNVSSNWNGLVFEENGYGEQFFMHALLMMRWCWIYWIWNMYVAIIDSLRGQERSE